MDAGEFFGEIGVLTETEAGVSIRAATMTTLYYLEKNDLDKALMNFPDFRKRLRALAHDKMKQYIKADAAAARAGNAR